MLHGVNEFMDTLEEDLFVDGVGEPGVLEGTSSKGSIDTNTTTGGDTSGAEMVQGQSEGLERVEELTPTGRW